jgi:sporulation protein YlmC with PRC-barrel domain
MQTFEDDNINGVTHVNPDSNKPLKYLTATSIIGDRVVNENGEEMGEIKNIMIDVTTGKIDYYVIEFGGFLGIGSKYFAIPFRLLVVDHIKRVFILNKKRETLENAPGFDKDQWPDTNVHLERVYEYWSFQ